MTVLFKSDFSSPDPRWKTRHTPNPDLPAGEFAPKYTDNGKLRLRLRGREDGSILTSHIAASDYPFVYGRFRARMKFSGPKGAHSAFWLQDVEPNNLGGSEVDIIEHFGSDTTLWHNVYWRTPETLWPKEPARWRTSTKSADPRDWHVYGVDWYPDRYVFTIDGKTTIDAEGKPAIQTEALSDRPKIMILSLLSSKWEWPNLQRDNLGVYDSSVDWVRAATLDDL